MAELDMAARFNRTLGRRARKDSEYLTDGYGSAYYCDGKTVVPKLFVKTDNDGRNFRKYATAWEMLHSNLCTGGCQPVINASILVVGHRGRFTSDQIFVPKSARGNYNLGSIISGKDVEVFADAYNYDYYIRKGLETFGQPQQRFDLLVDPEGRVYGVFSKQDIDGIEASWVTPLDLIEIPRLILALPKAGRAIIAMIARRLARREVADGVARELSVVINNHFRRSGPVTAEEMEIHLHDVLDNRPELVRLMRAASSNGEALQRATLSALEEWQRLYGRNVRWVENGAVQRLTNAPENLMSLQNGELWIEKQMSTASRDIEVHFKSGGGGWERATKSVGEDESKSKFFHRQVTHELSADALMGRGGTITGNDVAFIAPNFSNTNNAHFYLENAVLGGKVPDAASLSAFSGRPPLR
jgi:hypothetical protein